MAKPTKNAKIGNEVKGATSRTTATPVPPAGTTAGRTTTTTVRNTPVPKGPGTPVAPAKREITHEMIARRAYEISQSPSRGCDFDNWIRAERELRGEI